MPRRRAKTAQEETACVLRWAKDNGFFNIAEALHRTLALMAQPDTKQSQDNADRAIID